jgi:hypothetical protein
VDNFGSEVMGIIGLNYEYFMLKGVVKMVDFTLIIIVIINMDVMFADGLRV